MQSRDNSLWLAHLSSPGSDREAALEDLRSVLERGLPRALQRWLPANDPRLDALVEDTIQAALLRVLDKLGTFEGRSQFTTWVAKIAVRIALNELRRERWKDVSLEEAAGEEEEGPERLPVSGDAAPEQEAERSQAAALLLRILSESLSERQRTALAAMTRGGMPMDEVARRMGSNRNALYKTLHDARIKMKQRLEQEGYSVAEILRLFAA